MYIRHILENSYGPARDWNINTTMKAVVGTKFGLELEVEGSKLPRSQYLSPYWQTVQDGSLRALPEALEYKSAPLSIEGVKKALDMMANASKSSEFKPSIRTSTHVHINVQDMTVTQVANFIATYLLLEGSLYSICGQHRRGNVFCIPLTQCDDILRRFARFCREQNITRLRNLSGDGDKYAALSLRSIYYYGTLEVRTHEGVSHKELDRVLSWASLFGSIRDYATKEGNDPITILQEASNLGPIDFTAKFLGQEFKDCDVSGFWEGVSAIQYFASASKWEPEKPLGLEETPDVEKKSKSKSNANNAEAQQNNLTSYGRTAGVVSPVNVNGGVVYAGLIPDNYDPDMTQILLDLDVAPRVFPSLVRSVGSERFGSMFDAVHTRSTNLRRYMSTDGIRLLHSTLRLEQMDSIYTYLGLEYRPHATATGRGNFTETVSINNPNTRTWSINPADYLSPTPNQEAIRVAASRRVAEEEEALMSLLNPTNNGPRVRVLRERTQTTSNDLENELARELRDLDNHDDGED